MRLRTLLSVALVLAAFRPGAAQAPADEPVSVKTKQLPKALLWEPYRFELEAWGGIGPYQWRLASGSLPDRFRLSDRGELKGTLAESGEFEFTLAVSDTSRPSQGLRQKFVLSAERPLSIDWEQPVRTEGQRLTGSIRISNRSGRDFDLTVIVLAVNEMGRATAIGYQHFPLKRDTRDLPVPFGDSLAPGNYVVNVDAIAEEPLSGHIFRARLASGKESLSAGP